MAAVPVANKAAFIAHAREAWVLFEKCGALQQWECWGENVPPGEKTSFPMAVQAQDDEAVVFSWILWPDRETAQAAEASMRNDPAWAAMSEMPFDGSRMIYGDFDPVVMMRAD